MSHFIRWTQSAAVIPEGMQRRHWEIMCFFCFFLVNQYSMHMTREHPRVATQLRSAPIYMCEEKKKERKKEKGKKDTNSLTAQKI